MLPIIQLHSNDPPTADARRSVETRSADGVSGIGGEFFSMLQIRGGDENESDRDGGTILPQPGDDLPSAAVSVASMVPPDTAGAGDLLPGADANIPPALASNRMSPLADAFAAQLPGPLTDSNSTGSMSARGFLPPAATAAGWRGDASLSADSNAATGTSAIAAGESALTAASLRGRPEPQIELGTVMGMSAGAAMKPGRSFDPGVPEAPARPLAPKPNREPGIVSSTADGVSISLTQGEKPLGSELPKIITSDLPHGAVPAENLRSIARDARQRQTAGTPSLQQPSAGEVLPAKASANAMAELSLRHPDSMRALLRTPIRGETPIVTPLPAVDPESLPEPDSLQMAITSQRLGDGQAAAHRENLSLQSQEPEVGPLVTASQRSSAEILPTSHHRTVAQTPGQAVGQFIDVPVQQPGWDKAVAERVLLMAHGRLQNAELRLSPAELGPVRIRLSMDDGVASVSFHAQHSLTRDAIEQAMPRLRDMLAENGLSLGQSDVSDGGVSRETPDGGERSARNEPINEPRSEPGGQAPPGESVRSGNGRVDTFV